MDVALNEKCFGAFRILIHELTGITIPQNRISMVEGRLRKRLVALQVPSYEDYLKVVQEDRSEQTQFIDLITTNETYFFRTPRIWNYIENKFIPNWYATEPRKTLNIWSAAASSGDEAHSLGLICQSFKDKNPGFNYQILGTDISTEMVELCRLGQYSGRSIESFRKANPELFHRYMKKNADGSFQVLPEIKNRMRFQQHNLFRPFMGKEIFDLVLIRNVLIYFKGEDQEKVLALISPRISSAGVLIIGESESLSYINTAFKQVEPLIYQLNSNISSLVRAV